MNTINEELRRRILIVHKPEQARMTLPADNLLEYLERIRIYSFGIGSDPSIPAEYIKQCYEALDGCFLKIRPPYPSQRMITDTDDKYRIALRLKITTDFVMVLLSRARSLEMISPPDLRERVRSTLAEALNRNS